MTVKIGINGFGRIGRLAFRRIFELQARGGQAGDIEVAAINDLTTPSMLAYLLKYDSTHGTFRHDDGTPVEVTSTDDSIVVDGKTIVFGVNHETLKASDVIVSAGSCTTNSMAAMVKLLDENWGIKAGFMTTIHAYTGTQMILDGPRFPKARNNRAAAINTIPHSTGAAKAIGKVVPSVNGKLQGHAQRIQVPDGSVTELTTVLNKEVTADEINAAFKAAFSDTDFYGYNEDGIVSSDIIGDTHGGVFDPTQTDVNTVDGLTMARTVSWYDNEYGFTCNMVRTLLYFAEISE